MWRGDGCWVGGGVTAQIPGELAAVGRRITAACCTVTGRRGGGSPEDVESRGCVCYVPCMCVCVCVCVCARGLCLHPDSTVSLPSNAAEVHGRRRAGGGQSIWLRNYQESREISATRANVGEPNEDNDSFGSGRLRFFVCLKSLWFSLKYPNQPNSGGPFLSPVQLLQNGIHLAIKFICRLSLSVGSPAQTNNDGQLLNSQTCCHRLPSFAIEQEPATSKQQEACYHNPNYVDVSEGRETGTPCSHVKLVIFGQL